MRQIQFNGQVVDYTVVSDLSTKYDETNFKVDTEYVILDLAVLGNALGREDVGGDDTSSALAAVHGRKYNNARIALPFTRDFVSKNYAALDKEIQKLSAKASGMCSSLQKKMTPEQLASGRETAIRSRAIREARTAIQNSNSVFDGDQFTEANATVRAGVASKLNFTCGVSVSARRVEDTMGLDKKGQFKRKNLSGSNGQSITGYVTTADEKGLKRVPVFTNTRDAAEKMVYDVALVVREAVSKVPDVITDDAIFTALKEIVEKIPGQAGEVVQIAEFNNEELLLIEKYKTDILSRYNSI